MASTLSAAPGRTSLARSRHRALGLGAALALAALGQAAPARAGGRVVFVRHGQSQANVDGRYAGSRLGVPLTEEGRQTAKETGRRLRGFRFAKAYSSKLERAEETLSLVLSESGQGSLARESTAKLNERGYGDADGLTRPEAIARYGEADVERWRYTLDAAPPRGESLREVQMRAVGFLEESVLPALQANQDVIVVAHRHVLRALYLHLGGLPESALKDLEPKNAEPTVFRLLDDNRLHLESDLAGQPGA
jgi:2,3-bisphosphoglycerate-dependent phosphoglycerate mutase